jgi:hypothetical protein
MWKPASALLMTEEQRKTLEDWTRGRVTPQRMVFRAKICPLAADGLSNNIIAKRIGTSRPTVVLWRERFLKKGVLGISEDASHWSTRTMAKAQGVSNATVARIWDAHGLQPHRVETFKLSKDKRPDCL